MLVFLSDCLLPSPKIIKVLYHILRVVVYVTVKLITINQQGMSTRLNTDQDVQLEIHEVLLNSCGQ